MSAHKPTASLRALFPEAARDTHLCCEHASLSLPPSVAAFLRKEANACGMGTSHFVLFLLAFYREHMEEVRSLSQPWPVRYSDDRERVNLPRAEMKRRR